MTEIGIIRHGVTHWNKERRAQGSSDIPLDQEGLMQAKQLAERMSEQAWDIIYSSDLLRAQQTAKAIGDKLGLPLQLDSRLRELGGGLIEGTTEEERIARWGPEWRKLDLEMESPDSVIARGMLFMDEITVRHAGQKILIVSHGAFIRHMLRVVVPHFNFGESLKNTSVTSLVRVDENWDCSLYNCTKHLTGS
ncbi:histidine phosphatase family protein [Oceanobacillus saliphilus]|uniref:histidine phosphatase family protein n=1 Tax=Oceanobacillus saliphilus TaxID=2925834 RepID=UPI00201D48FB|nr:histidine phosphatase family protein [Oceanobacillus saliphilus]